MLIASTGRRLFFSDQSSWKIEKKDGRSETILLRGGTEIAIILTTFLGAGAKFRNNPLRLTHPDHGWPKLDESHALL